MDESRIQGGSGARADEETFERAGGGGLPAALLGIGVDAPVHPLGSRARVLLTSVFGPYAQDDEFGSRLDNPMELYHNQVTRVQGGFSLRLFHRSFGLLLIQANIDAPCTVLDFPTLERFEDEVRSVPYDVVGITSIMPNIGKVKKMVEVVRRIRPGATVVVGGHVSSVPNAREALGADHVVRGEGVRWMRRFLGQDPDAPVRHPAVLSAFGGRILGVSLSNEPRETAAILIPSVGCPVGCNFCATSSMFGGKGNHVDYYETGDDLYSVMCGIEARLGVRSFFILDENFLLHRRRALRLLDLMRTGGKSWSILVFSSARVIQSYRIEQLIDLGISWVWMGIEGRASGYQKLSGVDTQTLVRTLQAHGIRVLGSSIVGFEDHTAEGIDEVIDFAVAHDTDFHQFMLYTPVPGTPLHEDYRRRGLLLADGACPPADVHGQRRFNFIHPNIRDGSEGDLLLAAFRRDFEVNGPSLMRLIRTMLKGCRRYRDAPDPRVRERFDRDRRTLLWTYTGAIWTMRRWYRHDPPMAAKLDALLAELYRELGWLSRITAPVVGIAGYLALWLEERRLARGWTREPSTFYEKNPAAMARDRQEGRGRLGAPAVPWVEAAPRAAAPVAHEGLVAAR